MGVVYKARDPNIDREVALKVIRISEDADERFVTMMRERFQREARAAGQLLHPNIAAVFDAGEDQGTPYMTMELVTGETLDRLLRRRGGPVVELAGRIIAQIARGLDFAHQRGVIHRDVKPSNIIVCPDLTAKIMDFGIARIVGSEYTKQGTSVGTPNYMSPEQITGQPADAKSDIFALGVVLYEMLTGERPFFGESETTVSYRVLHHQADPPSKLNPLLDPAWDQVIAKALAKRPEERYANAAEMALDLERIAAGEPVQPASIMSEQNDSTSVVAVEEAGAPSSTAPLPPSPPGYEAPLESGAEKQNPRRRTALLVLLALCVSAALVFLLFKDKDPYVRSIKNLEAGRPKPALSRMQKLVKKDPQDARAFFLSGRAYAALADYENMVVSYARAFELEPDYQNDPQALDDLLSPLPGPEAEAAVALVAAKLGDAQRDRLTAGLENPDYRVHWNSARALERMGEKVDTVPLFIMDLEHQDCGVRKAAAQGLTELKARSALPALEKAKEEKWNQDPCMGTAIDEAITEIKRAHTPRPRPRTASPEEPTASESPLREAGKEIRRDLRKLFDRQ